MFTALLLVTLSSPAELPQSTLALPQSTLPCACDCEPCICPPGECQCLGCRCKLGTNCKPIAGKPRPAGEGWQWSTEDGGYWWRWKPDDVDTPTPGYRFVPVKGGDPLSRWTPQAPVFRFAPPPSFGGGGGSC